MDKSKYTWTSYTWTNSCIHVQNVLHINQCMGKSMYMTPAHAHAMNPCSWREPCLQHMHVFQFQSMYMPRTHVHEQNHACITCFPIQIWTKIYAAACKLLNPFANAAAVALDSATMTQLIGHKWVVHSLTSLHLGNMANDGRHQLNFVLWFTGSIACIAGWFNQRWQCWKFIFNTCLDDSPIPSNVDHGWQRFIFHQQMGPQTTITSCKRNLWSHAIGLDGFAKLGGMTFGNSHEPFHTWWLCNEATRLHGQIHCELNLVFFSWGIHFKCNGTPKLWKVCTSIANQGPFGMHVVPIDPCPSPIQGMHHKVLWCHLLPIGIATLQENLLNVLPLHHEPLLIGTQDLFNLIFHLQAHHGNDEQCYQHFDAQTAGGSIKPSGSSWIHANLKANNMNLLGKDQAKLKQMCPGQQPHKFFMTSWHSHHSWHACSWSFMRILLLKHGNKT